VRRSASAALAAALVAALPAAAAPDAVPAPPTGATLAALAQPPTRSPIADERLYFVMPDRYANGDPANDRGGATGNRAATGYDPADIGWFHGGDYKGLTGDCTGPKGLARIRDLGFTAIWVTPPFGQRTVQGSSAAYHGYWIRDFTTVDSHLGSERDFGAFADCAHRLGLKVYLDVVVNHTADVIVPTGSSYSDAPYRDCHGRVFAPARYAGGKVFPCLKAANMPRVPVLLPGDRNAKKPAWLNDVRRYHNRGDIDFDSCSEICFEQGDFFGLDDLFTEQPVVVAGLADVYASWIRRFKIDGFRVDTAKHVDARFFRSWVPRLRAAARAAGVQDFERFGEVFVTDAVELSGYVRRRGLPNVLDFPLQDAVTRFAAGEAGAKGIAARFEDDDYFLGANGVAHTPPTFLGNHDIGRAARVIKDRSGGKSGAELLRRVQLAHSLLYLLRGAPVVYYGDEVGIVGAGGDKQARQDLFPTQVREWQTDERVGSPPIGTGSSFDVVGHPLSEHLKALAALREAQPVLSRGSTAVRRAERGVLVVSRFDAVERREYVAAFNATTRPVTTTFAAASGSTWTPLFGATAPLTGGRLTIPALTAVLYRADALARTTAVRPGIVLQPDDLSGLLRVSAPGVGAPRSVAFALKRAGGAWRRVAVDDSPPFRAFLDPAAFRRGETIQLVAIARDLEGAVMVSRVLSATPRRR
jgi:glycosidase